MLNKSSIAAFLSNSRNINILFAVSLLFALTLRINFEIDHPKIYGDYSYSALIAKNFIEGHGFTMGKINLQDISKPEYISAYVWANGTSLIIALFYYITRDIIKSLVLLQILAAILLIFGFIRLLKTLELSKLTQSVFLLFTAFTATPYSYLGTTDLLTGALFLWIIALSIEICTQETRVWWKELCTGALLFSSATFRYACIPNILIIPCFFIFFSLVKKEKKIFYTGIKILAYAIIPTFIFFSIYKITFVQTSAIEQFHLRWRLLKLFDPFPLKAFFYTAPLDFRLPLNDVIVRFVRLLEYFLSFVILGCFSWYYLMKRAWWLGLKEKKSIDIFTVLSLFSFAVIVSFLSFLTLTSSPLKWYFTFHLINVWVYAFETRYFVILIFLIQIFFFVLMDKAFKKTITVRRLSAFVSVLFISSMSINVVYSSYALYQYHTKNSYSYWNEGKDMITIHTILDSDAEKNPGKNIVLATCWKDDDEHDPSIYSHSTTIAYQYDSIIEGKFKHTKPVILYVLMPENNLNTKEKNFILTFNAQQVLKWCGGNFNGGGDLYRAYLP